MQCVLNPSIAPVVPRPSARPPRPSFDDICTAAVTLHEQLAALAARIPAGNPPAADELREARHHAEQAIYALTALSMLKVPGLQ